MKKVFALFVCICCVVVGFMGTTFAMPKHAEPQFKLILENEKIVDLEELHERARRGVNDDPDTQLDVSAVLIDKHSGKHIKKNVYKTTQLLKRYVDPKTGATKEVYSSYVITLTHDDGSYSHYVEGIGELTYEKLIENNKTYLRIIIAEGQWDCQSTAVELGIKKMKMVNNGYLKSTGVGTMSQNYFWECDYVTSDFGFYFTSPSTFDFEYIEDCATSCSIAMVMGTEIEETYGTNSWDFIFNVTVRGSAPVIIL